jgi:uncharacterized delta-60 repeat protein
LQADGRPVLVGRFSTFDGVGRSYVARLNTNGSLDAAFAPRPNDLVVSLALQADQKAVIGGAFTAVNGVPRNYVARLNPDGSLDGSFDPGVGPDLHVHAIAIQSDGKIVIGGQFATVNGANRVHIARLNDDGSLDTSFDPGTGANSTVVTLTLQPDGRILAGGDFTNIVSTTRYYVARLMPNGALDASFTPDIALAFGGVLSLRNQIDGKFWSVENS